jgi:hypothetical protein
LILLPGVVVDVVGEETFEEDVGATEIKKY